MAQLAHYWPHLRANQRSQSMSRVIMVSGISLTFNRITLNLMNRGFQNLHVHSRQAPNLENAAPSNHTMNRHRRDLQETRTFGAGDPFLGRIPLQTSEFFQELCNIDIPDLCFVRIVKHLRSPSGLDVYSRRVAPAADRFRSDESERRELGDLCEGGVLALGGGKCRGREKYSENVAFHHTIQWNRQQRAIRATT